MRPVADLAVGLEEEARGWRIRPSTMASGGPVLDFFFFIFLSLELVGSCGGGETEHGGAGLEAEVLGGEFGSRTPLCSMEQQHGASCAVEKKMVSMGIELGAVFFFFIFSFHFFPFILSLFRCSGTHAA